MQFLAARKPRDASIALAENTLRVMVMLGVILLVSAGERPRNMVRASLLPEPGARMRAAEGAAEASAEIVPARTSGLGFAVSGHIAQLSVVEGDLVEAGRRLMILDTFALEAEIAQAEASLKSAEAHLNLLRAGPQPADVAVAEAELAVAEAAVTQAVAQRSQVTDETQRAEKMAAEADLTCARTQEMTTRLHRHQQHLWDAEAWKQEVDLSRLQSAEWALAAAEARVVQLPQAQETQVAQYAMTILEREAQRDRAEARLAGVRGGAGAEALALAEARVEHARAALASSRSRLASMSLHAPFDGTVVGLEAGKGEAVMPGQTLLTVADLSALEAKTTDLSERDAVKIEVGMPVRVFIEALNRELSGRVARIALQPDIVGGDVIYPVRITLNEVPPDLRWGMSAEVIFEGVGTE